MIDREKTIRDLETLGAWHTHHYDPFHYECAETIHNALELLKEQEPVKPRFADGVHYTVNKYLCGACGHHINQNSRYCEGCGRAVKWE